MFYTHAQHLRIHRLHSHARPPARNVCRRRRTAGVREAGSGLEKALLEKALQVERRPFDF